MSRVMAIDPGTRACGVAVFEHGQLVHACYVAPPLDPFELRLQFLPALVIPDGERFDDIYIEQPRAYAGRSARGDTNDILDLSAMVGALAHMAHYRSVDLLLVPPAQWKSNVDPDVCVERAKARLSGDETRCVVLPSAKSKAHNVWDAIGIGLWAVGRWWR